jgi:hypothetical protein
LEANWLRGEPKKILRAFSGCGGHYRTHDAVSLHAISRHVCLPGGIRYPGVEESAEADIASIAHAATLAIASMAVLSCLHLEEVYEYGQYKQKLLSA